MQRVGFARPWPIQLRLPGPGTGAPAESSSMERIWPAWALGLLALVAAVDMIWLIATPITLFMLMLMFPVAGTVGIALVLGRARLAAKVHMLLSGLGFMLAAWPALRIYNHLVMTTALPLADARLAGWDEALGLSWLDYLLWLDRHPMLLEAMDWVYGGLTAYSAAAFVLLLLLVGAARAREFVLLFLLAAVAASTIGLFFPALAAMKYYAPDPDLFQTIRPDLGTYHIATLERLRTLAGPVLDLRHMHGLTTFPSFHTAMGVLVVWCSRGSRLMFVPMLALNALMIASTPAFGSHYFVDILAGIGLAAAAILLLRRLDRGREAKIAVQPANLGSIRDT